MKKFKKNILLFSAISLSMGTILTVISCTSQNVIKDEKELKVKKRADSVELSQSEFDILKPKGKNGVVTEQVKTILDKIFSGIDSTNISKILFNLNETETKIIITPIEGYYFEGKLNSLEVSYTIKKENQNIAISIKEIKDKIQEQDIKNILGSVNTDKITSLNKLFIGVDNINISLFKIEKIDNTDKSNNIKLTANEGYIFNNTETFITSNKFTISTEVVPPPVVTTELKISKKANQIQISENELNILKSQDGVVTEQIKPILDKAFNGIDITNISKILFTLNEKETKIIIKPIEGYHFEGKLFELETIYTVLPKENINIPVSIKAITDKIEKTDIDNILGAITANKLSSLNKLFTGINNTNINWFNIEKVDVNGKTTNIKLTAIKGYIFNNKDSFITSNQFTVEPEVIPPPTEIIKLNIAAKDKVDGTPMTEPELRAIRHGATPIADKIKYLNKLFTGIDENSIKHIQTFDYTSFTQVNLTTKTGYVFANNTNKLDSIKFPRAPKVNLTITAKSTEVDFTDQDVEEMKSQDNTIKLKALSKVFDGLTAETIKGVTDPAFSYGKNTVTIFTESGYIFNGDKNRVESNKVKGVSKLVYIKNIEFPSGIFKEDFNSLKDPLIPGNERLKILLKFFKPVLEDDNGEFDFVEIKNVDTTNNKITIKTKTGYIFVPQINGGNNVYDITSGTVTTFAPSPQFLKIELIPNTKTITKQDISNFNDPTKKLAVLNKYFKNITNENIKNISSSINQYGTAISLRANSGYSLGKYIQVDTLESWWNLPERETNPTTGTNLVHQWMPRQQDENEAGPARSRENQNGSNYPFKWLSSSPLSPTEFPTLDANEKKIVDFYKDTTVQLTSAVFDPNRPNEEFEESGTAWYYPKPATDTTDEWTYFGTNIHVIGNLLTKTIPVDTKQKPVHGFYLKEDNYHKFARLNFSRDKQASINDRGLVYLVDISQNEMELVDLALDTTANYDINGKKRNMLDFAVLRVKTVGTDISNQPFDVSKHINKNKNINYDWIDTEAEFREVFENIEDQTFYVGGYPGGFWTVKSYTRNQFWVPQTTTLPIKGGTQWYTDPSLSKGNAVKLGGEEWYSMSNNIMFPNLIVGAGGSGSLITILHKGEVRPVAIFWGTFAQKNLANQNLITFSGADLFYTPNFFFKDRQTGAPGYNFTKIKTTK
ncbi:MAG: hypothetical protein ACRC9U_03080 [Metamycoplasmataceae bacterium]